MYVPCRPFDARMWCALGVCYEHLDRREEAVKCYERAMDNRDRYIHNSD